MGGRTCGCEQGLGFSIKDKTHVRLRYSCSDVCGPMPMLSMGGVAYFVTFIDDFSWKVWAYPLGRKGEVLSIFQRFVTLVETQNSKKVKCLHFDNGGEYISKPF